MVEVPDVFICGNCANCAKAGSAFAAFNGILSENI
jgi:hypothetical protein